VDLIHLDIMDGHFVPNISFGPLVVSAVRDMTTVPLDVHLMIESPERYIYDFVQAGADCISVHIESTPHIHRAIQMIRAHNVSSGVAVNPGTSIDTITDVLPIVDMVLIMTVNPGFGGQSFIPEMLSKVSRARQLIAEHESRPRIEVDGGIKSETIYPASEAGAEIFVCGSSVFNEDREVADAVGELRSALA
jgi:ribulose-phosphate 3-epimerase